MQEVFQVDQIIKLTENLSAAWNAHDLERIVSFYASDYVGMDVSNAGPQQGLKSVYEFATQYLSAFPDLSLETEELLIQGDRAAVIWKAQGTHRGVFMNIPPTNRSVTVRGISIMTVKDGKISHARVIWDVAGLLRDIHLLPEL